MNFISKRFTRNILKSYRFCSFYTQKSPTIKYEDEFSTRLNADGKLVPVSDTSFIAEVNDKYGLEQIRDPCKILEHLKKVEFQYPINELIYFVRHLVHIQRVHGVKSIQLPLFKELLNHIKACLSEGNHERFPYIGSLAYCFNEMGINDRELWNLMEQKILDDEYYTNFQESMHAIQGFTRLPLMCYGLSNERIQERVDKLYKKLERIVRITIWEVNVKHYHTLAVNLALVGRFDKETFDKLEQHIITNLSLNYETKMMVDILFSFAKGRQGSKNFYEAMQFVIFKGHMFNRNFFLQSKNELSLDGSLLAGLLGVYQEAQLRFTDLELHPDFKYYVYQLLNNKRTYFTLESATKSLENLKTLEDDRNMNQIIIDRISTLDGQFNTEDILRFLNWVESNAQDSKDLPVQALKTIQLNIVKYADQMLIDDLFILIKHLYDRPKLFMIDPIQFSERVLQVLQCNLQFMTGAQLDSFGQVFGQFLEINGTARQVRTLQDIGALRRYQSQQLLE